MPMKIIHTSSIVETKHFYYVILKGYMYINITFF